MLKFLIAAFSPNDAYNLLSVYLYSPKPEMQYLFQPNCPNKAKQLKKSLCGYIHLKVNAILIFSISGSAYKLVVIFAFRVRVVFPNIDKWL